MSARNNVLLISFLISLFSVSCDGRYLHKVKVEHSTRGAENNKRVLLVSFDGFRWDYFKKANLDNFESVKRQGVSVSYMTPPFITKTFPSHYTMATGLYEESHGVVGNKMWDPKFKAKFKMGNTESRWWNEGEPIWITVRKNNLKSGTFFWPGSTVEIENLRPNYYRKYDERVPWKQRVDTVMNWFTNKNVSFATLYQHEPDHTGHQNGPDSPEMVTTLKQVNKDLGYLLGQIKSSGLSNALDLILVSDHGMAEITNTFWLSDLIDKSWLQEDASSGTVFDVWPADGKDAQLIKALNDKSKPWTFYRKKDILERWHYKNNRRIPPYLLVAKEHWLIFKSRFPNKLKGDHGYDNQLMDMKAIFMAKGPSFKVNYAKKTIDAVDIYPMICDVMKIKCHPNNGTLADTNDFLRTSV